LLGLPAPELIQRKQNRCLTGCTVITSDLAGRQRHVTAADLVIRDRKTLGICWLPSQAIAQDFRTFEQAGEKMPVAIVLGGPATVTLAAHAELPVECDGFVFAGLLAGAPIEVATCRALALQVPAEAEIVLEGHVDPEATPFVVEHVPTASGLCAARSTFHAIDVVVGTGRAEAVVPAIIHAKPPNEQLHIDRALARIFLPIWQQAIPELVDFHYPDVAAEGLAVASFRKTFPFQSRQVASALWGQAATMATRMLVLVDERIDVRDEREVWFRVSANVDPRHDVFFREGPGIVGPGGSQCFVRSSHMALDATSKLPDERGGDAPADIAADTQTGQVVDERWAEYGLD
jgi:4-hydroxy-3-polyprenylbenzoate decarboxylase